jgi:hypothetical protein
MSTDARYRTKLWIETYDTPADITKDDDTTQATIINQYEKPPYPLKRVFFSPKNVDGIRTILKPTSTLLPDWKREGYAYKETVPINLSCVTKQGITGDKLIWKMESDLRTTFETYPLGSVRLLDRASPSDNDKSLLKLHSVNYLLDYKRAVTDYTSDVALSHGNGWQYDGDRLSGGAEGTWTLTDGGNTTQSVTLYPGRLALVITVPYVADSHTSNGTNLSLSSSTYTKIRFRYKTLYDTTAKVIIEFNDATTQTVLAETSSSTYTAVTATITSGKTIDHIHLYACDGAGGVFYDFIQIYADDFTFPNAVDIRFNPSSRNVNLGIPSAIGIGLQNLGADPATVELDCDLDVQYDEDAGDAGCWKRSGDTDAGEVFLDVLHNQSSFPWNWLVWGNKAMRVTMDRAPQRNYDGTTTLYLTEYRDIEGSEETYADRFGI